MPSQAIKPEVMANASNPVDNPALGVDGGEGAGRQKQLLSSSQNTIPTKYCRHLGNSTNCRIIFIVQEPGMGRSLGRRSKHSRASGCAGRSDPFYKDEKKIPMPVSKISHLDHMIGLESEEDGSKVGFLGETEAPRKHHVEPSTQSEEGKEMRLKDLAWSATS